MLTWRPSMKTERTWYGQNTGQILKAELKKDGCEIKIKA